MLDSFISRRLINHSTRIIRNSGNIVNRRLFVALALLALTRPNFAVNQSLAVNQTLNQSQYWISDQYPQFSTNSAVNISTEPGQSSNHDFVSTMSKQRSLSSVHQPELFRQEPGHRAFLLLNPDQRNERAYDPFIFLANDEMREPAGFPDHPHAGFETITYVIEGAISHSDSNGNSGVLTAGDCQYMTAGSGVEHSEMPYNQGEFADVTCKCTQLWLLLPDKYRKVKSRYQDLTVKNTKLVQVSDGVQVRVIIGEYAGQKSAAETYIEVNMYDIRIEAGKQLDLKFPSSHFAFFSMFHGSATMGSDGKVVKDRDIGILKPLSSTESETSPMSTLSIKADKDLYMVFYSGKPVNEPFVQRGPFIASNQQDLMKTFTEYRRGNWPMPVIDA